MAVQPNQGRAGKPAANQMMPEQFLSVFSPAVQALAQRLRELIKQTIPNCTERHPAKKNYGICKSSGRIGSAAKAGIGQEIVGKRGRRCSLS